MQTFESSCSFALSPETLLLHDPDRLEFHRPLQSVAGYSRFNMNLCLSIQLFLCLTIVYPGHIAAVDQFLAAHEQNFAAEFDKYVVDGIRTDELSELITSRSEHGYSKKCLNCRASVNTLLTYFKLNYTVPRLKDIAVTLCTLFDEGDVHICGGYVEIFAVNELEIYGGGDGGGDDGDV